MPDMEEEKSAMESSAEVRLDIPSLAEASIRNKLKEAPRYSEKPCIYRVPTLLRQTNEQAYTPALVSIGPFHREDERLLPMEAHKLNYLDSFLADAKAMNNNVDLLKPCLEIVKAREDDIRKCYADPIDLCSQDFCEMVLIDSAFIIQVFRDRVLERNQFLRQSMFRDIVELEENQLPLSILNQLYGSTFASGSVGAFTKIVCKVLFPDLDQETEPYTEYLHILHLVACHHQIGSPKREEYSVSRHHWLSMLKSFLPNGCLTGSLSEPLLLDSSTHTTPVDEATTGASNTPEFVFPQATTLHEASIKFKANEKSSCLFDIEFEKGVLNMTKLIVDDTMECRHRNLIAFEQCHYDSGKTRYFTDYNVFLNTLINTAEDVQLLADAGIVQNFVGSPQQVADLINSLDTRAYTSLDGNYYQKTSEKLTAHCEKTWPYYRAKLMHDYFSNPWAAISLFAAVLLLLLSIAGVVAAFLALP